MDRAVVEVEDMSDFGIVNVMKLMRFSYLDHLPWLEAMGSEVPRRAPHMEVQGLMHIVLACSARTIEMIAFSGRGPNDTQRGQSMPE